MKHYDSDVRRVAQLSILAAIVVGLLFVALLFVIPLITSPHTPTGPSNYGPLAADYLNSRRDDVVFYWIYNCTFVNHDLSDFYDNSHTGAYVDGVYMRRLNQTPQIDVLFAPWHANITGTGLVTLTEWETLAGEMIDNGIKLMTDASSDPNAFHPAYPPRLNLLVCFNDNTLFSIEFYGPEGLVYIGNGTWSGNFTEYGWPEILGGGGSAYWLYENGHLTTSIAYLFNIITTHVDYPE